MSSMMNVSFSAAEWNQTEFKNASLTFTFIVSAVLAIIILITIIGNIFVIIAILHDKNLQSVQNYLIVSLAVADLMVACLVMPISVVYEINGEWILGTKLCDIWTSCDVLCCTASILHLLAIAVDRYLAVTRVEYIYTRSANKIGIMIVLIWVMALIVTLGPLFGWRDPEFSKRITVDKICIISQDVSYQMFATLATFYVPLAVILVLYWKIFQVVRKRVRRKQGRKLTLRLEKKTNKKRDAVQKKLAETLNSTDVSEVRPQAHPPEYGKSSCNNGAASGQKTPSSGISRLEILSQNEKHRARRLKKECVESNREKKAAKTLSIVTGIFVVCWLPFFVNAVLMPLCKTCNFDRLMTSIFLWLGYVNSSLNPIIYTIFSPEFRTAFKRILWAKECRSCCLVHG